MIRSRWPGGVLILALVALAACGAGATSGGAARPAAPTAGSDAAGARTAAPAPPGANAPTSGGPVATSPMTPETVKVAFAVRIGNAPLFLAQEKGFFAEQGIDADFVPFAGSSSDMVAPMARGDLEVAPIAMQPGVFNALAQGFQVRMVADQGRYMPGASNTSVVVRTDLTDAIREARDLRGRRVDASVRGTPHDYVLFKLLEQGGLSASDLDVTYLTNMENGLLALRNQSIDVAVLQEPGPAFAEAEGFGRRWLNAEQIIPAQQVQALVFSEKFAQERPEVGRRLLVGYLQGVRLLQRGLAEQSPDIYEIIGKWVKMPTGVVAETRFAAIDPNGSIDVNSILTLQEHWVAQGLVPVRADVAAAVDPRPAEEAVAILGRAN